MAKKSLVQREVKRRLLVNRFSSLRDRFKSSIVTDIIFNNKISFSFELQKLPRNSSSVRLLRYF